LQHVQTTIMLLFSINVGNIVLKVTFKKEVLKKCGYQVNTYQSNPSV